MISLILAVVFFVSIHLFVSGTSLRTKLVERLGEQAYMGLFSILSLVGLMWMIQAYYGQAPRIELWGQIYTGRILSSMLIFLAFMFMVPGLLTPGPTSVGGEQLFKDEQPARGILRITRHPFLSGMAIWSLTHLIYNGDLASFIFFGSFLVVATFGPKSIDNKQKLIYGDDWQRFADKTSILPFIAIIQKRNTLPLKELFTWKLAVAFVAFIVIFKLHVVMFGVAPIIPAS